MKIWKKTFSSQIESQSIELEEKINQRISAELEVEIFENLN